jgi:hypothetical protein
LALLPFFFLFAAEKREAELEQRYFNLQQEGKLDKYMKQKRRRMAGEDKKKLEIYD